jgi:hypothetical protein
VADDFLDGSFAPLDEAGALVRSRVAENPQQVQVWIPSDAPAGAELEQVDETQDQRPARAGALRASLKT